MTPLNFTNVMHRKTNPLRKICKLRILSAMFAVLNTHSVGHAHSSSPIVSLRLEPFVMRTGSETCRLILQADQHVVSIRMPNYFILYRGILNTNLQLFDDGTHGDAVGGDHIFTIDQVSFDLANDP